MKCYKMYNWRLYWLVLKTFGHKTCRTLWMTEVLYQAISLCCGASLDTQVHRCLHLLQFVYSQIKVCLSWRTQLKARTDAVWMALSGVYTHIHTQRDTEWEWYHWFHSVGLAHNHIKRAAYKSRIPGLRSGSSAALFSFFLCS